MSRAKLSALTLTVLVLVLVVTALVGWRQLTSPLPSDDPADASASCAQEVQEGDVVRSADVTVSVFNAGSRSGLASQTQEELTGRGFIAGDVGNAPGDLSDVEVAVVLAPSPDDPAARLVARQFGRGTEVRPTQDQLGAGVEVVVGDSFEGLAQAPRQLKAKAAGSGC
jgi:LytR cell envelope-related transcriptional attenuator